MGIGAQSRRMVGGEIGEDSRRALEFRMTLQHDVAHPHTLSRSRSRPKEQRAAQIVQAFANETDTLLGDKAMQLRKNLFITVMFSGLSMATVGVAANHAPLHRAQPRPQHLAPEKSKQHQEQDHKRRTDEQRARDDESRRRQAGDAERRADEQNRQQREEKDRQEEQHRREQEERRQQEKRDRERIEDDSRRRREEEQQRIKDEERQKK